jgi:hypothetical protein
MNREELTQRVAQLEIQINDLQARLPAHSTPPSMLLRLDELEEQLAEARAALAKANENPPKP